MGATVTLDDAGLTVAGGGRIHGIDADLHDVGELTPGACCALRARRLPVVPARHRAHPRPRDRPTGRPRDRAQGARLRRHRDRRRPRDPARAAARRALRDVRRPPDGARRRGPRRRCRRGTRRGRRDHGEDVPGVRRRVGGTVRGMTPTGRYGEEDHESYERPRRHTRPRTKERPTYDDAVEGRVMTVDRGRYTCLVDGVTVVRDEVPAAGPQGRGRRRPGADRGRRDRQRREPGPDRGGRRAYDRAAAHRGRRRPGRARDRLQRRPAAWWSRRWPTRSPGWA